MDQNIGSILLALGSISILSIPSDRVWCYIETKLFIFARFFGFYNSVFCSVWSKISLNMQSEVFLGRVEHLQHLSEGKLVSCHLGVMLEHRFWAFTGGTEGRFYLGFIHQTDFCQAVYFL